MEGNKNAMYAQAGRSFGWTQVSLKESEAKINAPVYVPETTPILPVNPIPAPPVVTAPEFESFEGDCQTVAMAYVKSQKWHECYEPEQGFSRGTLFSELDLPFVGEGACRYE